MKTEPKGPEASFSQLAALSIHLLEPANKLDQSVVSSPTSASSSARTPRASACRAPPQPLMALLSLSARKLSSALGLWLSTATSPLASIKVSIRKIKAS